METPRKGGENSSPILVVPVRTSHGSLRSVVSGAQRPIRIDPPQEPCKSRSGALRALGLGTSLVADTGLKGVQQKCLCPSMPVERGSAFPTHLSAIRGQDL